VYDEEIMATRTNPRRSTALLSAAAVGLLALTGCGQGSDVREPVAPASAQGYEGAIARLRAQVPDDVAKDPLVVGYSTYVPFASAPESGDESAPAGLVVDVTSAVADVLGLELRYVRTTQSQKVTGILSGRLDMAIGGSNDTEARRQVLDVYDYLRDGSLLMVPAGNPKDLTPDDLCGTTVGAAAGTTFVSEELPAGSEECEQSGKPPISIQVFPSHSGVYQALLAHRVDATIEGAVVNEYNIRHADGTFSQAGDVFNQQIIGNFLAKGSPLTPLVRGALQIVIENGTYARILRKYGAEELGISCATTNDQKSTCVPVGS
jgi:polar amino acid transport system substrate-binding protein